jgi:PhnB protein
MAKVKYKAPKGYSHATPYLRVANAASAIDFYKAAFGAKERSRLLMGGVIGHAELEFGDARIMLSDEFPDMGIVGPKSLGNTTAIIALYVADADAVFENAVAAGATVKRPLKDEFYGDRTGQLEDPYGHVWSIQQRIEDVSPKKMQKRLNKLMANDVSEAAAKVKPAAGRKQAKAKGRTDG